MPHLSTRLLAVPFVLFLSSLANAQATSWLYLGAGTVRADDQPGKLSVQLDTGLGTRADRLIVVGGLARVAWYESTGTALGLMLRGTSGGFSRGGFGVGADVGLHQPLWGERRSQLLANLVLGAPWGLTLTMGSTMSGEPRTQFASLGFDFARLTVHRHTGTEWFPNPKPSP